MGNGCNDKDKPPETFTLPNPDYNVADEPAPAPSPEIVPAHAWEYAQDPVWQTHERCLVEGDPNPSGGGTISLLPAFNPMWTLAEAELGACHLAISSQESFNSVGVYKQTYAGDLQPSGGVAASDAWESFCVECTDGVPKHHWYSDTSCSISKHVRTVDYTASHNDQNNYASSCSFDSERNIYYKTVCRVQNSAKCPVAAQNGLQMLMYTFNEADLLQNGATCNTNSQTYLALATANVGHCITASEATRYEMGVGTSAQVSGSFKVCLG
jgi:hypothetical protein